MTTALQTTPIVTLDLWEIPHSRAMLTQLHRIQIERCDERSITGGKRPNGMRLSVADPVRRVKGYFDPFWLINFDDGVAERGYLMEDMLEVALFHGSYLPMAGREYRAQEPVRWHQWGITAFDFVVPNYTAQDRIVSCKSSISATKPSSENVAQERRMLTYAGYPAGTVFEVWMVDPGALTARGPFEYQLEQDHIDTAQVELSRVSKAFDYWQQIKATGEKVSEHAGWNDPNFWLQQFGLESSSGAFMYPRLDASPAIEARVVSWENSRKKRKAAEAVADDDNELLWKHIDEQLALLAAQGVAKPKITARSGNDVVTFSRKSNGHRNVHVRAATPADAPAEAA